MHVLGHPAARITPRDPEVPANGLSQHVALENTLESNVNDDAENVDQQRALLDPKKIRRSRAARGVR